ncbi:MAG TPA: S8 family serine peptidase [Coleofasciculaceae cyanobacterium]|jgi:Ca2+-binding RTX toxin-like protein
MVGQVTSEGDRALQANVARQLFNVDGTGIKIGVISDSYNAQGGAAENVSAGDLPGRRNPNGYSQPVRVLQDTFGVQSDEGRAMLQIIHDVAPGAELLFHTVGGSEEGLADAIDALTQAGADIIVDDIGFAAAPLFQDGVAAQAVTRATQQGVIYFSAAGNTGNRAYQSQFRSGSTFTYRGTTYEAHDFDAGAGVDLFQDIQIPQATSGEILYGNLPSIYLILGWDQAVGKVANDLELFLVSSAQLPDVGGVLTDSIASAPRADAPLQAMSYATASEKTVYLVIARRVNETSPTPGLLQWSSFAGNDSEITYQYVNDTADATGGPTIVGHPNAKEAIAVGAASYTTTPAFGGTTPVLESFSSIGGTPILFDAQGNRLTTSEVRQKPDLVGPNRVSTSVESDNPFFDFSSFAGTSAAAPHLAAVAALMLQRAGGRRSLTSAQALAALQATALPMNAAGNSSGAGFVQADDAVLRSFIAELRGSANPDRIQGTQVSENISGQAGNDRLSGAGGLDALIGGAGRDFLNGGKGNDYLVGDQGNDTLLGGQGRDRLEGGQGNDRLMGQDGNDDLRGGDGNDRLWGAQGSNRLYGGQGKDWFELDRRGLAIVQDFRNGSDRLQLPSSIQFSRLDLVQQGQNTAVRLGDLELATLQNVRVAQLNAADFRSV